jgi:hypothetical protein
MVICARERYAISHTGEAVRFLEAVLVPKVSAAYLDTMSVSYKECRDPRIRQSFFKGEPTTPMQEAEVKITSELIERAAIDVGFPPLDDGFPAWFVDQFVWPLAIERTRRYVCVFYRWREVFLQIFNSGHTKHLLRFSHHLQPSKEFLDHLNVDHGKLIDERDGDFAQTPIDPIKWPTADAPFSLVHMNWAKNHPTTYDPQSEIGDPLPIFRAEGLLWHEFFWRVYSDLEVEKGFDQFDFDRRAFRCHQEWLLASYRGVSPFAHRNWTNTPPTMCRDKDQVEPSQVRNSVMGSTLEGTLRVHAMHLKYACARKTRIFLRTYAIILE